MGLVTSIHIFSGLCVIALSYMFDFKSIALDLLNHGLYQTILLLELVYLYTNASIYTIYNASIYTSISIQFLQFLLMMEVRCRWQNTFIISKT